MTSDWRLTNQIQYLRRKTLRICVFRRTHMHDHEHCEFCMAKFGENECDLHTGYATLDKYYWICPNCFRDFKELFEWTIE